MTSNYVRLNNLVESYRKKWRIMEPSTLTKVKFAMLDNHSCDATYGYQETDKFGNLLHLYDENGEQLDSGNGFFPCAEWEALPYASHLENLDDFWDAIESLRDSI